jgi:hypothetical protein
MLVLLIKLTTIIIYIIYYKLTFCKQEFVIIMARIIQYEHNNIKRKKEKSKLVEVDNNIKQKEMKYCLFTCNTMNG